MTILLLDCWRCANFFRYFHGASSGPWIDWKAKYRKNGVSGSVLLWFLSKFLTWRALSSWNWDKCTVHIPDHCYNVQVVNELKVWYSTSRSHYTEPCLALIKLVLLLNMCCWLNSPHLHYDESHIFALCILKSRREEIWIIYRCSWNR